MTVGELQQMLDTYADDTVVLIPGYESGWDVLKDVRSLTVCARPDIIVPQGLMPSRSRMNDPIMMARLSGAHFSSA